MLADSETQGPFFNLTISITCPIYMCLHHTVLYIILILHRGTTQHQLDKLPLAKNGYNDFFSISLRHEARSYKRTLFKLDQFSIARSNGSYRNLKQSYGQFIIA